MIFTAEQLEWREKARAFADEEVRPAVQDLNQQPEPQDAFDPELVKKGSRLGLRTGVLPREWGGSRIDAVTQVLVLAELARADSAVARTFSQCWRWGTLLASVGTEDQKRRFLEPFVAEDSYLIGSAGTEPQAGSDHRVPVDDPRYGWMMSAEPDGDEWVLNGRKQFIANGSTAKLFFTSTRTDPTVPYMRGTTVFLVPSDAPGLRAGRIDDKIGWRFNQNSELIFENVRVSHANVVGEVNGGVHAKSGALTDSDLGQVGMAAIALGVCEEAFSMALQRCRTHREGGELLIDHQAAQLKLSEMAMLIEALRSFVMRIALEIDNGEDRDAKNNTLAASFATDAIRRVTDLNMDIHGEDGLMRNVGAEKLVRDAVIWTHLVGDSVLRMKVIKHLR